LKNLKGYNSFDESEFGERFNGGGMGAVQNRGQQVKVHVFGFVRSYACGGG